MIPSLKTNVADFEDVVYGKNWTNIPHCNTDSYSGDMDWVPQLYKLPLMHTTVVQETTPGGIGGFKRGCWAIF